MEINFAIFEEIYSSLKPLAWFIAPYLFSIIGMSALMLLKKGLRGLYYGSKRNRAMSDDKAKGKTPGKLWHFSWLIIIVGAGLMIILLFLLRSQTQNLPQETDPSTFLKGTASYLTLFAYLFVFQSFFWKLIEDFKEQDTQEEEQDERKEEERQKMADLEPLRRRWVTFWTAGFLVIFIFYLNAYVSDTYAAVIVGITGISCQTTLKGIAGWITLIMRQKFKKGKLVKIGDIEGEIDRITLMAVVIKEDGEAEEEIHIPTSTLFDQIIIDLSPKMDSASVDTPQS